MTKYVRRNGASYIAYSDRLYDEPVEITHFWPISEAVKRSGVLFTLEDLESEFEVRCRVGENFMSQGGWIFILPDGGATKPAFSERTNVFPPKTKLKTVYKDGFWHKIMKSGGWVRV